MSEQINYSILFTHNGIQAAAAVDKLGHEISDARNETERLDKTAKQTFSGMEAAVRRIQMSAVIDQVNRVAEGLNSVNAPAMALSTSMYDLQAITGVTGGKLQEIEGYARESAKTFGGSAADNVEAYKLILSQLSPEIADKPAALKAMGDSVSTLSKTMGGNAVAATEVLTTAMNQYGISTADPIKASEEMARMMNVMAAGAKEGSAELPMIKSALEQAGMAASAANVSFEETNAAIQVLDKAGKKGSEGGVALRNVLATLSEGRFLPKEVQQELQRAGVSIADLTNKSLPLATRLQALAPIMNDSALVTKVFGKENSNAALALMSGTGEMKRLTQAITGTNTAYEQAAIVMESPVEKAARLRAQVDDVKISMFNATGGALGYVSAIADVTRDFSNLMPAIDLAYKGVSTLTSAQKMAEVWTKAVGGATKTWTAIQTAFNAVMEANPLVWVAAIVVALVGGVIYAYNHFEKFRAVVDGVWQGMKSFATLLKDLVIGRIQELLRGVAGVGQALYLLFTGEFEDAMSTGKQALLDIVGAGTVKAAYEGAKNVGNAYVNGFNSSIEASNKKAAANIPVGVRNSKYLSTGDAAANQIAPAKIAGADLGSGSGTAAKAMGRGKQTTEAIASGGTRNTTVNVNIGNQVGSLSIQAANVAESAKELEDIIVESLTKSIIAGASLAV